MKSLCPLVILVILVGLASAETDNSVVGHVQLGQNGFSDYLPTAKRSTMEFMGMRVSYPQYVRLRAIQREVVRMDQTIRHMLKTYSHVELAQNQHWIELLELYEVMRKMLPQEYLESVSADSSK